MGQQLIMAEPFLVDTDVLVDFLRGYSKAVNFVNAQSSRIILSSIVVAELYAGVKGDAEQTALENFVSLFRIVPVSSFLSPPTSDFHYRIYPCRCSSSRISWAASSGVMSVVLTTTSGCSGTS